jgi:hypothetical protein
MEFAIPKDNFLKVAEPALTKFIKHFYPELNTEETKKDDGVPDTMQAS